MPLQRTGRSSHFKMLPQCMPFEVRSNDDALNSCAKRLHTAVQTPVRTQNYDIITFGKKLECQNSHFLREAFGVAGCPRCVHPALALCGTTPVGCRNGGQAAHGAPTRHWRFACVKIGLLRTPRNQHNTDWNFTRNGGGRASKIPLPATPRASGLKLCALEVQAGAYLINSIS